MIKILFVTLLSIIGLSAIATEEYPKLTPKSLSFKDTLKNITNSRAGNLWNGKDEGVVELLVTIGRDGKVGQVEELSLSQSRNLNRAARKAVRNKRGYPPIPEYLEEDTYQFHVRLTFKRPEKI